MTLYEKIKNMSLYELAEYLGQITGTEKKNWGKWEKRLQEEAKAEKAEKAKPAGGYIPKGMVRLLCRQTLTDDDGFEIWTEGQTYLGAPSRPHYYYQVGTNYPETRKVGPIRLDDPQCRFAIVGRGETAS